MNSATFIPASCGSCGINTCEFNAEATLCRVPLDREAWLLDEVWPEFDSYLIQRRPEAAFLFGAWKSRHFIPQSYRWSFVGDREVIAPIFLTLRRSLKMRGTRWSGGKRQAILEQFDRRYASFFARKIPYNIGRLVVWQNFLPFLHQDKALGGREYDILMWRAPRHVLEGTLDFAAKHYPQSSTVRDFRSAPGLAEAERIAFERAQRVVTPHYELAKLYPSKTMVINWAWPPSAKKRPLGNRIAFLGPTAARRGAYLVRSAMQKLKLPLLVIGNNVEHPNFWNGIEIEERPPSSDCLRDVGLLLSPAITDFKPRLLMQALHGGVPVIATRACGLPKVEGLHFVDPFDVDILAKEIEALSAVPTTNGSRLPPRFVSRPPPSVGREQNTTIDPTPPQQQA